MKTPTAGDPLYLDGFLYTVADTRPGRDDTGAAVLLVEFVRPPAHSAAEAETHRLNVGYRKGGKTAEPLEWVARAELLSRIAVQAATVKRGSPSAGIRLWAPAAAAAQADKLPDAAWVLPERVLLYPPSLAGGPVQLPRDAEEAELMAEAVLAHSFHLRAGGAAAPVEG